MPKIVDHEQQRRELSATVAEVVAEQGLEQTTLRSVAAAHGCTKGMVQHYFSNKEALLAAALEYVEEQSRSRAEEAAEGLGGLDQLTAELQAQLPLKAPVVEEWRVRLAFNSRTETTPVMRDMLSEAYDRQLKSGLAALRRADKAGELRSGVNLRNRYRALMALVSGIGVSAVTDPSQLPAAAQKQMLQSAIDDLRR